MNNYAKAPCAFTTISKACVENCSGHETLCAQCKCSQDMNEIMKVLPLHVLKLQPIGDALTNSSLCGRLVI